MGNFMGRTHWFLLASAMLFAGTGCAAGGSAVSIIRDVDAIQVMSPEEVTAMRSTLVPTLVKDGSQVATDDSVREDATANTIPLNEDKRPPELKLFDAFKSFSGCLEDAGEGIRGDLQDPNNPAYQDPAYLELIQKCAARSDIVNVLEEVSTSRANLTPEEIKAKNEGFVVISDCLKKKGWKIETTIDASGLITPSQFQSADGELNDRDLNQCISETGLNDAIEDGA
jgi:hypothetical protein